MWNVEERVMRDKDHRQRPTFTHTVLKKVVKIGEKMNQVGHMKYLRNKYQDLASLLQFKKHIIFTCNHDKMVMYDIINKDTRYRNFKLHECEIKA